MAIIKRQEKSFGENMEKIKLSYNVSGSCKLMQAVNWCRKQYEGCSKNEKNRTEIWASNYTSGYLLEENKNTLLKIYMYLCVHYSTIYSSQDMEATSFC